MKHVDTPQTRCLAGVARGDITPPVGIYHRMWGAAMHDRSTGVHRPLTSTVLILRPAPEPHEWQEPHLSTHALLVLVAVDHCLLWGQEMSALAARIAAARKYLPDFGVAGYCGFGRIPPEQMPAVLAEHVQAIKAAG